MLKEINQSQGYHEQKVVKALILIDGTGSMQRLIDSVKNCIDKYFSFVSENLKKNGYNTNLFKMQIAIYRSYSSGVKEILEVSPWAAPFDPKLNQSEQGPELLKSFLQGIKAKDGQ